MDVFLYFLTRRAFSAGILFFITCAQDILGVCQSQNQRTVSRFSGKQLGMTDPPCPERGDQSLLDIFMSDYILKHLYEFRGKSLIQFNA